MKPLFRLAAATLALAVPATIQAQEITVAQGRLAGTKVEGGGALFAGIPYAAPPVGPLRWKAPAAPAKWSGVRDAKEPGATCMQPNMGWNAWDASRGSEDCLTLNVWVPDGEAKARPVMVWFHGGGFVGGSGSAPTYNGTALTKQGVILVTVNYRLGLFGFLAHPELTAESPGKASGNYGLQDQLSALKWVNANIARFGGDPANVTIFGQSAGAMSVAAQIAIPESRRYFKRAILESGSPFGIGDLPALSEIEQGNAGFGKLSDLRAMSSADVMAAWGKFVSSAPAARRGIPIIDGKVLRQQPSAAYVAGVARDVPLILGSVVREQGAPNRDALVQTVHGVLGADPTQVIAAYDALGSDPVLGDPATQLMADAQFRCGSIMAAGTSDHTWLYHFFENFPGRPAPAHSAEVFYVFDTAPGAQPGRAPIDEAQRRLSQTMIGYWTNFAKNGDPNGLGLPAWPRYSTGQGDYVELAASGVKTAQGLRKDACAPFLKHWAGNKSR